MAKHLDLLLGGSQFHKVERRSANTFQITAAHIFDVAAIGYSLRYATPKIHPSTCATARSGGVRPSLRNTASVPSLSARESQPAML